MPECKEERIRREAERKRRVVGAAMGREAAVTQYSFCTNGSHYAGEAGIPTVGLGPSREDLAHTDNEYIELEQLFLACESDQAIMRALLR